jgi:hypothetical protein
VESNIQYMFMSSDTLPPHFICCDVMYVAQHISSNTSVCQQQINKMSGSGGRVLALIINQLASRGITFLLNVAVARTVGTAIFGLQAVNLYLLYTTILFVAREGIRRATQRPIDGIAPRLARQLIINISALVCLPLSLIICV